MGARGRKEISLNRHAPAHRSIKQGYVREDSAGPVRARPPPADGSGAHDGVAASSPYLTDGDGVRVTAPVHQARSPNQLG
ncbi:hypothetical protein NDU88_003133 [Pleurodeles waltl]|uniref:Uncharacterized protein n=1 Tax=Pleurodeles waltl TaxID=8319 RepID=A0AAV7NKK4_PLEWA|nr:hypothetical protein NDU88_003133 [Pleurodeles waltl]